MNIRRWEPMGVFGSCQTRIPRQSDPRVDWTDAVAFRCTWQCWRQHCKDTNDQKALATTLQGHRRSGNNKGSTTTRQRQAWAQCWQFWVHWWHAVEHLGTQTISLCTARIAVELSGQNIISLRNTAAEPGNRSCYSSLGDSWNSSMQFVFSSMYLCMYIAIHVHSVYLHWLQAIREIDLGWAWG